MPAAFTLPFKTAETITFHEGAMPIRRKKAATKQRLRFLPLALGQAWFNLDPESLNLVQAVVERHIWPPLWDPVIITVLRWPAWAVLGLPALVLLILPVGRRTRVNDGWTV